MAKVEKSRYWTAIVYPESANNDWQFRLETSGIAWACSPLHDRDVNDDGTPKKPHWHVIIQWGNTTTASAVNDLLKACCGEGCTIAIKCVSPEGSFNYLTHKNAPTKYQYEDEPRVWNGFKVPKSKETEKGEEVSTMKQILRIVIDNDIQEFCDLMVFLDDDQFEIVMKRAYFVNKFIESYRFKNRGK